MKLSRAFSYIGVAVAGLALVGWLVSYMHPIQAKLIRNRPDDCWFAAMGHGKLIVWTQEISPPPPDSSYNVRVSEPFHMRVSGAGGLFTSNFNPDWPYANLGWNTVQNSSSTVIGAGGSVYNFTLRVRALVLAWWVIVLIALIPLAMRGLVGFLHRRQSAYNPET